MADDIKGLNELGKLLDRLPARVQERVLKGAVKAGAEVLVAPTRAAAPVFTGRLEQSIVAVPEKAKSKKLGMVSAGLAIVGVAKRYWHLPEFGTVKMAARPFLRPTFAAHKALVLDNMKWFVRQRLPIEARKLARETGSKSNTSIRDSSGRSMF